MTTILDRLDELEKRATPGPWRDVQKDDPRGQPVVYYRGLVCTVEHSPDRYLSVVTESDKMVSQDEWPVNCKLVALSRTHLRALIDAARALPDLISRLETSWERRDFAPDSDLEVIGRANAALAPLMEKVE